MSVLGHYQRRLCALLLEGKCPAQIRDALREDPQLEPLWEYVESLQDAPLEVAVSLASKWGRSL